MNVLNALAVRQALPWPGLIEAIETLFAQGATVPQRQVLSIEDTSRPDGAKALGALLLMPAWIGGDSIGVKAVTFFPGNRELGLSTISAAYLLFDGRTGAIKAACDGDEITVRRTAATSAAAAKRLARMDAKRLLVVGTGQLAPNMALAHACVRSYDIIEIYGRDPQKAAAVVRQLGDEGLRATVAGDLATSAARADVICSVTSATSPVILGEWLKPGTHVDLVGGFKDDMREADDACVSNASIFVDARAGALLAGDLAQPIRAGIISETAIRADLRELVTGVHRGRSKDTEITLFKSVGNALEDLAAGKMIGATI